MNNVCLQGRITKDLEIQAVGNQGHQKCKFTIAVDSGKKDQQGNSNAYFFMVEAWDKVADTLLKWTGKGKRINVCGRLVQDSWQGQDGKLQSMTYVLASQIDIIDFNDNNQQQPAAQNQQPIGFNTKGQPMYNQNQRNQQAAYQQAGYQQPPQYQIPNNIPDDELPF